MTPEFENSIKKYLSEKLTIEIHKQSQRFDEPGYIQVKLLLEGEIISEDSYFTD